MVTTLGSLAPLRPPCSVAERSAARAVAERLSYQHIDATIESFRAPTSATWAPLLRAVLRVWAAAFLAARFELTAFALAALALATSVRGVSKLLRHAPLLGGTSQNVIGRVRGSGRGRRRLVVVAHLDAHPSQGAPLARWHRFVCFASAALVVVAALAGGPAGSWRWAGGIAAAEAIGTLAWLAGRELARSSAVPDDNTSGLMALEELAQLTVEAPPAADVWLVATGATIAGGFALADLVRRHPELRDSWVVELDALGSGEMVAAPIPPQLPRPGTPPALVRAVVAAARATGDPLAVRRVRRPHSDARSALNVRVPAITVTAGILHPARRPGPDPANAARAARIVYEIART